MTPARWNATDAYLQEVFGAEDEALKRLRLEAAKAGLPDISIGPVVGRFLKMLTAMSRGLLALEVGTLGGYSALWIARGLRPLGRLITIESEPRHADFAERQFSAAGMGNRVHLRRGAALEVLPRLAAELPPASVDLVFLDADKREYPDYWKMLRPLVAPGGLVVMDNSLGSGDWWIDTPGPASREAADRANRMIAADGDFEAVSLPVRQGVLVARRKG